MKYRRHLIMAICMVLIASMLCSAAATDPEKDLKNDKAVESALETTSTEQISDIENIAEGYTLVAKSTALELYFNESDSNLAVKDIRSGETWYSCPIDRADDSRAVGSEKDSLAHLFSIACQAVDYSVFNVDSYAYCIESGNFTFKRHKKGVSVNYTVGQKKLTVKDLPPLLRTGTYKDLYGKATDSKEKNLLRKLYSYNTVSKAYVIGTITTIMNSEVERMFDIFKKYGYDMARIDEEFKAFGIQKQSIATKINLTIDFSIENDKFYVELDTKNLLLDENIKIQEITLLNNFGARKLDDPGFILIPDGLGALILFDKYSPEDYLNAVPYKANVYGSDVLNKSYSNDNSAGSLSMPMFALSNGKSGFICMAEEGAGLTGMNIDFPRRNSYFRPYFSIAPFKSDTVMAHNWKRLKKYNDVIFDANIKLTYTFLNNIDSYNDIATAYRSYLLDLGYLSPKTPSAKDEFTILLHTVGEVEARKAFLIFPYNSTEALTTFSQAQGLIDTFLAEGAEKIFMVYDGAFNGYAGNKNLNGLQVNGKLGGNKGWQALNEYAEMKNTVVFPRLKALVLDNPGFFTSLTKGAQKLNGHIASIPYYSEGTGYNIGRNYILLRTSLVEKIIRGFSDKLKRKKQLNIAFDDVGNTVYTSGKGKKVSSQQDLIDAISKGLDKYSQNDQTVMLSNPSLYALKYADIITDLPLFATKNKWFNQDIPFLPMLYSGSLIYAGEPLNDQDNLTAALLKSVETGSLLQFTVLSKDPKTVLETFPGYTYSTKESVWSEYLRENIKKIKAYHSQTANKTILKHSIHENGLRETIYENGIRAIVNYGNIPLEYNGYTVGACDFICIDANNSIL